MKKSKHMVAFIEEIRAAIGKPKFEFVSKEVPHELLDEILAEFGDQFKFALDTDDKNVREANLMPIKDAIHAKYDETYAETEPGLIDEAIYKAQKVIVRRWLLDEQKRVDAEAWMKFVRCRQMSACCPVLMVPACSPVGRPRSCRLQPSADQRCTDS